MKAEQGIYVNLYNDCRFTTDFGGENIRLDMRANAYESTGAKISIDGKEQRFTLALRVPTWADKFTVTVGGEKINAIEDNGYLIIDRVWSRDKVEVKFASPVKMRVINGKIAFTKGPIALTGDCRLGDINSPLDIKVKDGKTVRSKRVKNTVFDSNIAYEINTRDGKVTLCDYAQAGKNYDDEQTGITVWHEKK